jgi:putative peptidoglycan lipid II flippase
LVVRAFCAQQDTVRPLLVAAVWSAVSVGFGAVLMAPMGHGGLALANSLAITGELLTLLVILRRRWQGIDANVLLATLGRSAGATLAMGVAMAGAVAVLEGAGAGSPVAVAGGAVTGSLVYLSTAALLRLRELRWPIQIILGRRVAVD